jgi:hypothetical protein
VLCLDLLLCGIGRKINLIKIVGIKSLKFFKLDDATIRS